MGAVGEADLRERGEVGRVGVPVVRLVEDDLVLEGAEVGVSVAHRADLVDVGHAVVGEGGGDRGLEDLEAGVDGGEGDLDGGLDG